MSVYWIPRRHLRLRGVLKHSAAEFWHRRWLWSRRFLVRIRFGLKIRILTRRRFSTRLWEGEKSAKLKRNENLVVRSYGHFQYHNVKDESLVMYKIIWQAQTHINQHATLLPMAIFSLYRSARNHSVFTLGEVESLSYRVKLHLQFQLVRKLFDWILIIKFIIPKKASSVSLNSLVSYIFPEVYLFPVSCWLLQGKLKHPAELNFISVGTEALNEITFRASIRPFAISHQFTLDMVQGREGKLFSRVQCRSE